MAQARERLARTDLDNADSSRVDIRRLPGSLYTDHGKCHGWHGGGRHRGERPVPLCLGDDDGSYDGARYAALDTTLPYRRSRPLEPGPGSGWYGCPAGRLHRALDRCGAAGIRLLPVRRRSEPAGYGVTGFAPRSWWHLPVHAAKADLPRSLQQPIVLPDEQLAAGGKWSSAAGDAPRRRLPGLLRWADGGAGGFRNDELGLDANGRAHHLRGEDDPGQPPRRPTLGRRDGGGRHSVAGSVSTRRDCAGDEVYVALALLPFIHRSS